MGKALHSDGLAVTDAAGLPLRCVLSRIAVLSLQVCFPLPLSNQGQSHSLIINYVNLKRKGLLS